MLSSVHVGIDPCVDPAVELGAVDDSSTDFRVLLVDSVNGTAEDPERQLRILERTDESPELRLLVDILLYILLKKRGPLEVPFGVFRLGSGREGDIPAITKPLDDFVGVEIAMEHGLPYLNREGWEPKGLAESVHVRADSGVLKPPRDPIDMIGLDVRTGTPRHLVALTRFRRASEIVRFVEFEPESMIEADLICPLPETLAVRVVVEFVRAVVRGKQYRKGGKFVCQGIET